MTSRNQEGNRSQGRGQGRNRGEVQEVSKVTQSGQTVKYSSGLFKSEVLRGGIEEELYDVVGDNLAVLTWSNG